MGFAIKIEVACANCGDTLRTYLSSLHTKDNLPGLAPAFCSDACASNYLLRDDVESLR